MPVVNTVYFDPAVGGTGLTVTDDGNSQTGLDNDGHRVRFVPALQNLVYIGAFVKQRAVDVDAAVDEVIAAKNTMKQYVDAAVDEMMDVLDDAVDEVMDVLDDAIAAKNTIEQYVDDAQAIADDSAASALLAEKWASQITFPVADTRWSAREYANHAKSIADSMVNNIGLSRVDGGDAMTTVYATTIDGGGAASVFTGAINCGNAI